MPVLRETIETDLPVEAAFDYVANFEQLAEWDPGATASTKLDDGPAGVGTRYDVRLQYGTSQQQMTYTITQWAPPNIVVLEGDGKRTHAVDRITFRRAGDRTVVEYEADITLKGVMRFASPFLGRVFDRIGKGAVDGMKRRLDELAAQREGS